MVCCQIYLAAVNLRLAAVSLLCQPPIGLATWIGCGCGLSSGPPRVGRMEKRRDEA